MEKKLSLTQLWYTRKEIAELKGIPYRSLLKNKLLQPNFGKPDAIISGRERFHQSTVKKWLNQTDKELRELYLKNHRVKGENNGFYNSHRTDR